MIDFKNKWPSALDQAAQASIDREVFVRDLRKYSEAGIASVTMTMRDGSNLFIVPPFLFDQNEIEGCVYRRGRPTLIRVSFEKIVHASIRQNALSPMN